MAYVAQLDFMYSDVKHFPPIGQPSPEFGNVHFDLSDHTPRRPRPPSLNGDSSVHVRVDDSRSDLLVLEPDPAHDSPPNPCSFFDRADHNISTSTLSDEPGAGLELLEFDPQLNPARLPFYKLFQATVPGADRIVTSKGEDTQESICGHAEGKQQDGDGEYLFSGTARQLCEAPRPASIPNISQVRLSFTRDVPN